MFVASSIIVGVGEVDEGGGEGEGGMFVYVCVNYVCLCVLPLFLECSEKRGGVSYWYNIRNIIVGRLFELVPAAKYAARPAA